MMYPILCKVKFETLHLVFRKKDIWVQIGFSIFMNWIIAPFLMVSSHAEVILLRSTLTQSNAARVSMGIST